MSAPIVIALVTTRAFAEARTNQQIPESKTKLKTKVLCLTNSTKRLTLMDCVQSNRRKKPTSHHVYDKTSKSWKKRRSSPQPYLDLSISIDDESYSQFGYRPIANHPERVITVPAMAGTGCQSCLMGFKCVQKLGLTK